MSRILTAFCFGLKTSNKLVLKTPVKIPANFSARNFNTGQSSARFFLNKAKKSIFQLRVLKSKVFIFSSLSVGFGATHFLFKDRKNLNTEFLDNLVGSLIGLFGQSVECERQNRRTDKYEETIGKTSAETEGKEKKELKFDWKEFFALIKTEKFYFLAAIVVSLKF